MFIECFFLKDKEHVHIPFGNTWDNMFWKAFKGRNSYGDSEIKKIHILHSFIIYE